jgi:hypothetical protein
MPDELGELPASLNFRSRGKGRPQPQVESSDLLYEPFREKRGSRLVPHCDYDLRPVSGGGGYRAVLVGIAVHARRILTGVNTVLTQFHHETREQAQSGLRATVKDERFVISTGLAVIVFVILVTLLVLRMLPP